MYHCKVKKGFSGHYVATLEVILFREHTCLLRGTLSNNPITWALDVCPNPHLCISGATGTGKTYMIREIVESFNSQGVSFTIIDKHGDIDTISAVREYRLGYASDTGINPLAINPLQDYGGPKAGAQSFLSLLKELSGTHKLGLAPAMTRPTRRR